MKSAYFKNGQSEEFSRETVSIANVHRPSTGRIVQQDAFDGVPEVVDPVQVTGLVVDRQSKRTVDVRIDEINARLTDQRRPFDFRYSADRAPEQ